MLRAEMEALLRSPDFARSPVMSQLLTYLVEETIAQPDKPPKAYQIAVEGLGRSEDFDAQTDSYPRVQVGRLRKMLTAHYAASGASGGLRIPVGNYAVELQTDENKAKAETGDTAAPDKGLSDEPSIGNWLARWLSHRPKTIALVAALLLIPFAVLWFLNSADESTSGAENIADYYALPPKIYIEHHARTPADVNDETATEIELFFEDAFASSSQVRLAMADRPSDGVGNATPENGYLFKSELVDGASGLKVNLSLTSLMRNETIWSETTALPESPADYPEKLGPFAGRISSIYGVIAADQRRHLPDEALLGYGCLLRFESYRSNRDPELLPVVESCIAKSLAADPLDSEILAAASFIAFLRKEATGRDPDPEAGLEFARRAMVRGREDASANFALARSSFFNGSCARGKEFAERAVELAPYEATIQAQTGAYLFACNDPDAEKYLRRAIGLDPRGSIVAETALVMTLLQQGKDKEALTFAEKIVPSSTGVGPYYDIAMALAYARNGKIAESRTSWNRLLATYGEENDESPEQMINRLIINPDLAGRTFQLLSQTGVIETAAHSRATPSGG